MLGGRRMFGNCHEKCESDIFIDLDAFAVEELSYSFEADAFLFM
jgi:hypothetical protein